MRKNTDGPEIGDLSQESRGTAAPWGQANQYLRKNQVNTLHSEAMEGGQPRINLNHRKLADNTGSEREEPKVRYKKKHQVPGSSNSRDEPRTPEKPQARSTPTLR